VPQKKIHLPEPAAVQSVAVNTRKLSRVGARPAFLDYRVRLWDFREFIFYDARARVLNGTRRGMTSAG
jgi:teichoic acid transport system permease protein